MMVVEFGMGGKKSRKSRRLVCRRPLTMRQWYKASRKGGVSGQPMTAMCYLAVVKQWLAAVAMVAHP